VKLIVATAAWNSKSTSFYNEDCASLSGYLKILVVKNYKYTSPKKALFIKHIKC
jgi:hypothetical protein